MEAVATSTNVNSSVGINPTGTPAQTSPSSQVASATTNLTVSSSSSSAMTSVGNDVQAMLGAIDPALAGNELLKMAITMLILEVLLGQDSDQGGAALMAALGSNGSSASSSSSASYMYSETTTVQVDYASEAYASQSNGGAETTGTTLNATA